MAIKHKHHIIPKHLGGDDCVSNLIELSVPEHALAHKKLWEIHGKVEDKIAWLCLSGQIDTAEATRQAGILHNTGKTHTDITRKKMSIKRQGRTPTLGKKWNIDKEKCKNMGGKGPRPHFNQTGNNNNYAKSILTPYGTFGSIKDAAKHISSINGLKLTQNRYIISKMINTNNCDWKII